MTNITSSSFKDMVTDDANRIAATIGSSGMFWSLLKKRYAEDYGERLTYSDDSLRAWITRGIFTGSQGQRGAPGWSWRLPEFAVVDDLVRISNERHRHLLPGNEFQDYLTQWDKRNVYDFLYANLVNHPGRVVADIGAGYGRNAFLFVEHGLHYICVDGIEVSYLLQHEVLDKLYGSRLVDYIVNRDMTQDDVGSLLQEDEPMIVHLPTWRLDLIPDSCASVTLFVASLDEMPVTAARFCLDASLRFSSEQGVIFFRGLSLRRMNYLNLKLFARFNSLHQVLNLEKLFPDDSPGDTFLFRFDGRPLGKRFRRGLASWVFYGVHSVLRIYHWIAARLRTIVQ